MGLASALVILIDELVLGHRQHMAIMNVVHPVSALYWGPVWLWAYFARGRRASTTSMHRDAQRLDETPDQLRRRVEAESSQLGVWHIANADSHCGAGCTLGDIAGEWIVFALGPLTIAGATVWPEILFDLPLAWLIGIVFQYFTIVPMRSDVRPLRGLWLAARADTLSILSFQVGLFAWMILSAKVIWQPPLDIDTPTHWWMMQVGMIVGFLTAYPVNHWLIGKRWKEKMDPRRHLADMVEMGQDGAGPELPRFEFDSTPHTQACEKCGAGPGAALRFTIVRGSSRYAGRTLCDTCAEEVLETLLVSDPEAAASRGETSAASSRRVAAILDRRTEGGGRQ
jgi:Domain of unknown function (DUF4396)